MKGREARILAGVFVSVLAFIAGSGYLIRSCNDTRLVVENRLPGGTIENVRWVSDSEIPRIFSVTPRLLPGEQSDAISVPGGGRGHLELELIVSGQRVALRTDESVTTPAHQRTILPLAPETAVTNRAL